MIIIIIIIYNSITIIDCFTNNLTIYSDIYIVYFIYINPSRNWKLILTEQMKDLNESNILKNNKLFVVISCDNESLVIEAKYLINLILNKFIHNIDFTIEEKNLFEYPGIKKVYDLALNNNDKLFIYFHSKGITRNKKYSSNKNDNYNIILKDFNKIKDTAKKIAEDAGIVVPFLRAPEVSTKQTTAAASSKWSTLKFEEFSNEKSVTGTPYFLCCKFCCHLAGLSQ